MRPCVCKIETFQMNLLTFYLVLCGKLKSDNLKYGVFRYLQTFQPKERVSLNSCFDEQAQGAALRWLLKTKAAGVTKLRFIPTKNKPDFLIFITATFCFLNVNFIQRCFSYSAFNWNNIYFIFYVFHQVLII